MIYKKLHTHNIQTEPIRIIVSQTLCVGSQTTTTCNNGTYQNYSEPDTVVLAHKNLYVNNKLECTLPPPFVKGDRWDGMTKNARYPVHGIRRSQ